MNVTVDVTLPSEREIQVKRTFRASAARLWDCHTKPELVKKWLLGPDGWTMPVCDIDLRVGGTYHYEWSNGDMQFGTRGKYLELAAPHRIVFSETMDGFPTESHNTFTLEEKDGVTTLTMLMDFQTKDVRDAALQSGMTDGMATSFDRLERQVAA